MFFVKTLTNRLTRHPLRMFRAIGFRMQLIILLVGVLGTTLSLFSTVLYTNFIRVHEFEFDAALYNYAVNVARNLDVNMFGEVVVSDDVFRETEKIFPFSVERTLFQLITADGRFIAKSRELRDERIPIRVEDLETVRINRVLFSSASIRYQTVKHDYRIAQLFIDRPGSNDFVLQVAAPMILLQREKKALILFFLLSIPTAVIAAGALSYALSKRALSPINDIIKKSKEISASNLSDRLPVPRVEDELRELALTLNDLLNRLQLAFISQESFVSDASHQLKTPLAILKGELDVMRRKTEFKPGEIQEFIESASEEVRYLAGMVERLLILARVESGGAGIQMSPTRLDELAIDVVSRLQKNYWITKKHLKLQLNFQGNDESDYETVGDFDLIRTTMENLIDNAAKYSREATTVTVEVAELEDSVAFRVKDEGQGFTSTDQEKLFSRFGRLDPNSKIPGSGLGLSIVKKVSDIHGATLFVKSEVGVGSLFEVRFKKA